MCQACSVCGVLYLLEQTAELSLTVTVMSILHIRRLPVISFAERLHVPGSRSHFTGSNGNNDAHTYIYILYRQRSRIRFRLQTGS